MKRTQSIAYELLEFAAGLTVSVSLGAFIVYVASLIIHA